MVDDRKIVEYYKKLDRAAFMGDLGHLASVDSAFSIGYGQTISQPSLVLKMTLMLELCEEDKVLEIGTGSGYQTAMLSPFAKEVYTVERIEPLMISARERLTSMGYENIRYRLGDGSQGWDEFGPYDKIIVTAAAHSIPDALIKQLAPEGIMVIPVGGRIQVMKIIRKRNNGSLEIEDKMPVIFVKLKGEY